MIHPIRVSYKKLRCAGRYPLGKAFVVFQRGGNLPAHDVEHNIHDGHLFRKLSNIRKSADDIGKQLRQGMGFHFAIAIDKGREVGRGRSGNDVQGYAICNFSTSLC